MASCPNCGRATERTQDWACQWCGYPLVSGSFRQILKTYEEVKAERLQDMAIVEVIETDIQGEVEIAEVPEVAMGVVEETVEPEIPETEVVVDAGLAVEAELEIEPETSPEPEPVAEVESTSEDEPVLEESVEIDETVKPVTEDETPEAPGIMPITIDELNEVCKDNSEAAEVRFAGIILQITAEVGSIPQVESTENPSIILMSSEKPTAMNVLCIFDKEHEAAINKLNEGQLVTVQGRYDGCIMNILVNDCVLID